jgi:hypothetical protein
VITRSAFESRSNFYFDTVLAELDGAVSARGDGGFPNNPYVDHIADDFTAEGKRVIHLHYCLPVGYAPNGSLVVTPLSNSNLQQASSFDRGSTFNNDSSTHSHVNNSRDKTGSIGKRKGKKD